MSLCNYTQQVSPNTCLGDSLITFNANFSALDEGLCRLPTIEQGFGVSVVTELTEQEYSVLKISNQNSYVYGSKFEFQNQNAVSQNILLRDGSILPVTTFPYVSAMRDLKLQEDPYVTFSTITLTNNIPKVSIFWTASADTDLTLYATNSSVSINSIEFNGPVTALLSSQNLLYVGGEFTTVGGVDCKKFCVLDMELGADTGAAGRIGSFVGNPFFTGGDLERVGTINVIKEYTSEINEQEDFVVIAGSFQSLSKGRSLCIWNRAAGQFYPFYVNGTVHDAHIVMGRLYISGKFDFINYAAQSASDVSGLRVYCNSIACISLDRLERFPNSSIDKVFAANSIGLFVDSSATVNCIESKADVIYIGGTFEVRNGSTLMAKNLASIDYTGTFKNRWKPILLGESVYAMQRDNDYLYVGGVFHLIYTAADFYAKPRPFTAREQAANAICFNVSSSESPTLEFNWKPSFNGAVTKFAFHDADYGSYVYATGSFTRVNDQAANYIAAVEKSYENNSRGNHLAWRTHLNKGPYLINRGLINHGNAIVVGGNFDAVNGEKRSHLARLTRMDESLSAVPLSSVNWNFGAQLCNQGTFYGTKFTDVITTSAYASKMGIVNETVLNINPNTFKGCSPGQLIRFGLSRPVASDNTNTSAYVLGWKVDFN